VKKLGELLNDPSQRSQRRSTRNPAAKAREEAARGLVGGSFATPLLAPLRVYVGVEPGLMDERAVGDRIVKREHVFEMRPG